MSCPNGATCLPVDFGSLRWYCKHPSKCVGDGLVQIGPHQYHYHINMYLCFVMIKLNKMLNCCLRNKSWKPECIGSFNMDWRILVFYPEPEASDKIY